MSLLILIGCNDSTVSSNDIPDIDLDEFEQDNINIDVEDDSFTNLMDINDKIDDEAVVDSSNEIIQSDESEVKDTEGISEKRGFPVGFPWVSFYGSADGVDLKRVKEYFRIINIDADPDTGNFTDRQIEYLKNDSINKVILYLNVGSCENWRTYYKKDPSGFKSCVNSKALTTFYSNEYPDEMWADLTNYEYQNLIINYVAKRLVHRGVDGFFLDNLEVIEHGQFEKYGPCGEKCFQGEFDIVYKLRKKYPDRLIVMQNATSDITLNGYSNGVWFFLLLDGVSHEEVYSNGGDLEALTQMKKWRDTKITINSFLFWLAVEEYVGKCDSQHKREAETLYKKATDDGFYAYVTDESSIQQSPCFFN